jgi:RES domain-containing protein
VSLKGFPRRTLRGDRTICRIHRSARRPWWFSSDGSGRFDPVGSGAGACYLAEDQLGAWVEVFRRTMVIAEVDIHARLLFSVSLGRDLRLADLTSRRALSFGATASLGADEDYDPSHAFAVGALDAGFDGIRYLLRHDPAQRLYGIALFADEGEPDPADPDWPAGLDISIPDDLVERTRRLFRYRVLPTP